MIQGWSNVDKSRKLVSQSSIPRIEAGAGALDQACTTFNLASNATCLPDALFVSSKRLASKNPG